MVASSLSGFCRLFAHAMCQVLATAAAHVPLIKLLARTDAPMYCYTPPTPICLP